MRTSLSGGGMEGLGRLVLGIFVVSGLAAWGVAKVAGSERAWVWIPAGPVALLAGLSLQGQLARRKMADPVQQAELEAQWAAQQQSAEAGMQ